MNLTSLTKLNISWFNIILYYTNISITNNIINPKGITKNWVKKLVKKYFGSKNFRPGRVESSHSQIGMPDYITAILIHWIKTKLIINIFINIILSRWDFCFGWQIHVGVLFAHNFFHCDLRPMHTSQKLVLYFCIHARIRHCLHHVPYSSIIWYPAI